MKEGLHLLQMPGRGYYRGGIIVGYLRRVLGDEWELLPGARPVLHVRGRPYRGLHSIAADGIGSDYELRPPTQEAEAVHRGQPVRVIPIVASAEKWRSHVTPPGERP